MKVGVCKNRFFGSGGANKKSWFPICISMVCVGMGALSGAHAADVVWNFGTTGTPSPTSGTPVTNLTISDVSGTGALTAAGSTGSSGYGGASAGYNIGFSSKSGLLDTVASAYFQFTLTPASNSSFLLSAVSLGTRSTSTGPKNYSLRSSLDNYSVDIVAGSTTADSGWYLKSHSGLSVASSSPVTFRVYGYGGTSTASNWKVDDVKISVSVISGSVVYANGSLNPFSNTSGTPSVEQTFIVSGYNLGGDLTVTPPAGFEIKTTGDYTSSPITVARSSGSVAPTTVMIRVASTTAASSLSGNVTVSSSGTTDKILAANGTVSPDTTPFISVSTNALPMFSISSGSVSASQSFTASAKNLTSDLTVTAAGGFQVSTNGVDYASSLTLAQTDGLSTNTVSVRVAGTNSAGSFSGNVVLASAGATSANVAVTATVTNPALTLNLNPAMMYENATSAGTVTLPTARLADLTINLNSGTPTAATVPASVILSAGQTSVNFVVTGVSDSASYAERSSLITASAANCTNGTATILVLNSDAAPIIPISLDGSNSNSYSQNFNGLGTNTVAKVFPASNGVQVSLGAITANTVNGWYGARIAGSGTTATDLLANAGTTSTGTLYSFGNTNDTNRALGTLATGTTTMAFGALIKNDTGGAITNVKVSFTAEFWRSSTLTSNVLTFGYGTINGTNSTEKNFLTTTGATPFTALNITGPAPVASNGALDGNSPVNIVAYSNVALPLVLGLGEMTFLRWQDLNDGGDDAGIGIDNFTLSYEVDRNVSLSSFSPTVGVEGTQVTIRGANFTVGIPVKFNGIAASLVSVVSPTELAVTVPSGATTGYITVGEGVGSTVSTTAFVVGDFSLFPDSGNLAFASKMLGSELVKSCYPSGGLMSGPTLDFSIDPPSPDFTVCSVFWDTPTEYGSTASIPLNAGLVDERYFVKIRFAPTSTGLKTAVLTLASGGMEIGKYTLTGTGTGLAQPTYFAGYGQNGQAALYWGTDPSYDLVLLGKEGSSVTDAPSASGTYTGNTNFGSGTPVGSSTTIFSGFDSSVSNTVVTGLNNNQFYYFKILNRNPSANVVSVGKEIRVMPYADITSGVVTRWNFNNSYLSPSTGSGVVETVGGVAAGFVNGVGGSSDRASINKAASVKGAAGQFTGLQFAVSTVGKKEVKVFWDIAASGSASKYTRFQYTLNIKATAPVWVDYTPRLKDSPGVAPADGLYVLDAADSTLLQRSADLSSISGVENNANFGFRVITAYAPGTTAIARADGTSAAYSTAGTLKYDMVTVTGVDVVFATPLSNYLAGFNLTGSDALGDADPDGDGMNNNAEFAFGTSPIDGSSRAVEQTSVTGGIKISWLQRSGVTYTVKSSTDLMAWVTGTVTPSRSDPQPGGLPSGYEQWETTLTGGDKGFLKVEAVIP